MSSRRIQRKPSGSGRKAALKSVSRSALKTISPSVAAASVVDLKPQMGFQSGPDGRPALTWARYNPPFSNFTAGFLGQAWWGTPGSEISRERALASAVSLDLLKSNPTVAALVEQFSVYAVGNGLTLSSRPDHAALGITPEQARDLSHQIEQAWAAWAGNPLECDASGRHTLHQLATASFKSYLLTGESVSTIDWKRSPGAATKTKIQLLDSRQLAQEITRVADGGETGNILQGVEFSADGRLQAFWLRPYILGNTSQAPMPIRVPAYTSWGRQRVVHLYDLLIAGQVRGLSPLIAALSPAHAKQTLREFTLIANLIHNQIATTIESDLPPGEAMRSLQVQDPLHIGGVPGSSAASPEAWLAAKGEYYGDNGVKIDLTPGNVVHLLKGDKLRMTRPESPGNTYDPFDRSLARDAAKAAGSSYEDLTGDFSMTNFSAARLALELPWRVNLRRRAAITERFYDSAFRAFLEEAIEGTGAVKLPAGAPAFWENPAGYTKAVWRGSPKPVSDPLKQAQADVLRLANGLTTYEAVLGENGMDFDEVIAARKAEREMIEAAGLQYPAPTNIEPSTPDDDDPALK